MEGREKYLRQTVAKWIREQADDFVRGCDEMEANNGITMVELPDLPGDVSHLDFCDTLRLVASENDLSISFEK